MYTEHMLSCFWCVQTCRCVWSAAAVWTKFSLEAGAVL